MIICGRKGRPYCLPSRMVVASAQAERSKAGKARPPRANARRFIAETPWAMVDPPLSSLRSSGVARSNVNPFSPAGESQPMNDTTHDPDAGLEPAFAAPANACDAHFHVFGPPERYTYDASDLRYKPPHAPVEAYLQIARRLGFTRYVFVQPSAYGYDNSC